MRMEGNRPEAAAVTGDGWSFQCAASSMKIDRTIRGGGGRVGAKMKIGRWVESEIQSKVYVRAACECELIGIRMGCGMWDAVQCGAARREWKATTRLDST